MNAVLVLLFADNNVTESLEESAAAYTKATAKRCLLEKVEVRTGEESESNVLQVCKRFPTCLVFNCLISMSENVCSLLYHEIEQLLIASFVFTCLLRQLEIG